MRIQADAADSVDNELNISGPSNLNQPQSPATSQQIQSGIQGSKDDAHEIGNQMIVDAERRKISLEQPKGKDVIGKEHYTDQVDDEFFHVTCHIDQSLKEKIEAGKFVDLEKLLIKDRPFTKSGSDSTQMGIFSKDGLTYFAPTLERDTKISNIQKWEQAFRVYAAIYSKVNPTQASEIWQYAHTINSASTSYVWSNVAEYDFTIRQLMSEYPDRSWAKTYLQDWNLIMRDLIPKDSSVKLNQKGFNKDNICWPFNKGKCINPSCVKEHRCTYCGKWGYSQHICHKGKCNQKPKGSEGSVNSNVHHGAKCD